MAERKYAKIINEKTYEVQIGVGCPDEYYIEIGMEIMNVELGYDGCWYVAGHAPIQPEPTVDEKKAMVRAVRDQYINEIEWRVSRYRDQKELGIATTDDENTYIQILEYMQYLRDYPESSETWYEQNPLTFEEWVG
ncbi:MAG: hypothetical protein IK122_01300 [Alphaproteobacteria bacterium]|nr:hypothetical protein [Alphaproteobacteria bacterium]